MTLINMNIKSMFKNKQAILESKLSILLDHPVTKGEHCESAWIDFFRSFLPNKYSVDKGFVFDSQGGVSEQIDIIIYDSLYSPLIFGTDAGEKFITAESVYAVFDSLGNEIYSKILVTEDSIIENNPQKMYKQTLYMLDYSHIEILVFKSTDFYGDLKAEQDYYNYLINEDGSLKLQQMNNNIKKR